MKWLAGKVRIFLSSIVVGLFLFIYCVANYCIANYCYESVCLESSFFESYIVTSYTKKNCNVNSFNLNSCFLENCCINTDGLIIGDFESNNMVKLSFDKIFPETQLSRIFDSCINIYKDLDIFREKDFFNVDLEKITKVSLDFDIFTDLLVGKLFDIKVGISKVSTYHEEDIIYLNTIFDKILLEYKTTCASCPQFINNPKSGNIQEIIKEIKKGLEIEKIFNR